MLRVLVVDDEMLARDELKYLLYRTKEVDIIDEADSIETAVEKMLDFKPDIVFLDIQLSEDNGFELANRLARMKQPPAIVFATAYDQYAVKAFEVDALDYILKPFDEDRIIQTIQKYNKLRPARDADNNETVSQEHKENKNANKLALSVEESIVLLPVKDIVFAGLVDGKVAVRTLTRTCFTNDTLVVLEKKLTFSSFFRVHRSFIVNLDHILELQPWFNSTYTLIMKDGSKVPVSRTYAKELKQKLGI